MNHRGNYWRLRQLLGVWLLVLCAQAQAQSITRVIYPSDDFRYAEYIDTLRTALDKTVATYGPYTMAPMAESITELRFLEEAHSGERVNVVWSATSRQKEKELLAIKIPLSKGLLGYRIALIRKDMQPRLNDVYTREDLRQFTFGLGIGWGDVPIYLAAGFTLDITTYENLFLMLSRGRYDIFSRGVNEVFVEYEHFQPKFPNLAIEQQLLLHYPYPFYFFVSPHEVQLAKRIEAGMRQMIKDGSLDAIFNKYNGDAIRRANFSQRRIIELDNPELPEDTPLNDATLWYNPKPNQ